MNASLVESSGMFLQKPTAARIKIGYVSSDLRNHPLGHLMLSGYSMSFLFNFQKSLVCMTERSLRSIAIPSVPQMVQGGEQKSNQMSIHSRILVMYSVLISFLTVVDAFQ